MLENALTFPEIGHVGYIVKNADQAARAFRKACGISDFRIYEFVPQRAWSYGEEIFDCKFRIALGTPRAGAKIELIQVISGEKTTHLDFLHKNGEHVHHIAYYVDDYDAWREYYLILGATIIFEAQIEDDILGKRSSFYANIEGVPDIIEFCKRTAAIK